MKSFWRFCSQPIPPDYYDFINDKYEDDNNTPGAHGENIFLYKKVLEDVFVPNSTNAYYNDEYIDNDTVIVDADSFTSTIDPL